MDPAELARILTAAHPRYQGDDLVAIGTALAARIAEARSRWPALSLPEAELAEHLAGHIADGSDPRRWIEDAHVGDLALAWAATSGDDAAVRLFEAEYGQVITAAVAKVASGADADDAAQRARVRLLVGGQDGVPKLRRYSGRGPLEGWLRVLATRTALESRAPRSDEDELERLASAAAGPEQALTGARDRATFKDAFAAAIAALDDPQRLLLSQYYLDGVTVEELGRLHRSHASTISRRLSRIRRDLMVGVRRALRTEHRLDADEIDDIVTRVESQLELSLSRLLRR